VLIWVKSDAPFARLQVARQAVVAAAIRLWHQLADVPADRLGFAVVEFPRGRAAEKLHYATYFLIERVLIAKRSVDVKSCSAFPALLARRISHPIDQCGKSFEKLSIARTSLR
jgi:hypothetical protein